MKLGKFSQSVRVWCIRILMSRVEGSRWHACRATVSDDPPSARLLMQPRCVTVMSSRYLMHCIASFATVGRAQVCSQSLWCLLRAASLSCFSSTMECYRTVHASACFARQAGFVVMYLLCFYIMFYSVPHMVDAIFILVAWSLWVSGKLYWVLYKESYCSHLVKEEAAVQMHAWFSDFWTKEFKRTCVRVLILNFLFRR